MNMPNTEHEYDRIEEAMGDHPGAATDIIYRHIGDDTPLEDDLPDGATIITTWDASPSAVTYADIGVVYIVDQ